jgi:hypothetical protein
MQRLENPCILLNDEPHAIPAGTGGVSATGTGHRQPVSTHLAFYGGEDRLVANDAGLAKAAILCGGLLVLALGAGCGGSARQAACEAVISELTMPFDYEVTQDGVRIAGADGTWHHFVFGPWGAHNSPHTGHPVGNGKADMMVVLTNGPSDLASFDGGPCEDYTPDAPNCGLPREQLLAQRPVYVLPNAFSEDTLAAMERHGIGYEVMEVYLKFQGAFGDHWNYWDTGDQWEVTVQICDFTFGLGHLSALTPELIAALADRGISYDFDDFDGPVGTNLLGPTGHDPLPLAPGTPVAYPQLVGTLLNAGEGPAVDFAVPHRGRGVLWAQVEFGTSRYERDTRRAYNVPSYDLLDAAEYAQWEALLHAEMENPESARYSHDYSIARQWLWRAEGRLAQSPEYEFEGTENGLLRRLGDWWEIHADCQPGDVTCDEVVAFNRIQRDTPVFDPSLYSADSRYILWWLRTGTTPFQGYYGEILWTDGDLEADATGRMLVQWRDFDGGAPVDGSLGVHAHQYLAWRLGDDDSLRLAWGTSTAVASDTVDVDVPAADAVCDGVTLTCLTGWNESQRHSNIEGQL